MHYGFNSLKFATALGVFCLVLTVTDRLSRWGYRTLRGAFEFWKDEVKDIKAGGKDLELVALEEDEFVKEGSGWESPFIEKRSHDIEWATMI